MTYRSAQLRPLVLLAWSLLFVLSARSPLGAQASSPKSPYGTQVKLTLASQVVRGELLAVSADSAWIFHEQLVVAIARSEVRKLGYRRHNFGGRRALIAGGVATGTTTLAMALACSMYNNSAEGNGSVSCGNATGVWFALTSALTALTSLVSGARQWQGLPLVEWDVLTAHARFPQGLPASFRRTPPS